MLALLAAGLSTAACGGGGETAGTSLATTAGAATTTAPATTAPVTTVAASTSSSATTAPATTDPVTTVAASTSSPATTAPDTSVATTVPSDWPAAVAAMCNSFISAFVLHQLPEDPATSLVDHLAAHRAARTGGPVVDPAGVPAELRTGPHGYAAEYAAAEAALADAERAAATGDIAATEEAMDEYLFRLEKTINLFAVAGTPCALGDPADAERADLDVPVDLDPLNVTAGFGSLWVTEHDGTRILRVDPVSGEVLATIEVDGEPVKMQPADGRMWGRTEADAYFAIDPATNKVTDTLAREAVGPDADRAWAVDGGLWICDGQRIHRYDPTTLEQLAVIEIGIACDMPGGTRDLIVASTYNGDDGQSETSAAAFIDPATNQLLATVSLPVDVVIGIVLDDSVFFAGEHGSQAVVVDRATWTVRSTPDLGTPIGDLGTIEADAGSVYVPTLEDVGGGAGTGTDVLVVDTSTFAVTDVIPTLGARSVTVVDGSLWTAGYGGYLQRFDL